MIFPTKESIAQAQIKWQKPKTVTQDNKNIWRNEQGKIWIYEGDKELITRLIVIAHCGNMGHRGIAPTVARLEQFFSWKSMQADVTHFIE